MQLACITDLGYSEVAEITFGNEYALQFLQHDDIEDNRVLENACTYLWVLRYNENCYQVLYVGEAGYGLNDRWNANTAASEDPNGAFLARLSRMREYTEGGDRIFVFARTSDCQGIFGQSVPLCHAEEIAAHNKFNPQLNAQAPGRAVALR